LLYRSFCNDKDNLDEEENKEYYEKYKKAFEETKTIVF